MPDEGKIVPKLVSIFTSAFLLPSPLCSLVTSTNSSPNSEDEILLVTVQPDAADKGSNLTLLRLSSQSALQPVSSLIDTENCASSCAAPSPDE